MNLLNFASEFPNEQRWKIYRDKQGMVCPKAAARELLKIRQGKLRVQTLWLPSELKQE